MKHSFPHWRIYILFGIVCLAAGGIVARLFLLQVVRADYYAALAYAQHLNIKEEAPIRGEIYFQDKLNAEDAIAGVPYFKAVINEEMPFVYASPREIEDAAETAGVLAPILQMGKEELEQKLSRKESAYAPLARQISDEKIQSVEGVELKGIYIAQERVRRYPANSLAAHVLGFLGFSGDERVGQYGIEGYYNDELRGKKGVSDIGFFDFSSDQYYEDGANLELSIDYNIQFIVEKKLQEAVERWGAESGSAIFMNPKTGEILAMANVPAFNPNTYGETPDINRFINNAIQGVFEPGSVMKPITLAAAIDAGAVNPNTAYNDTGEVRIGGYTIRNSDLKAHGETTMTQVLEKSLNTGAVFAQQTLGKEQFRSYLYKFRLNERTGIDLPGEVPGNLGDLATTNRDINFATASFGQGIAVSRIGFLDAFSALANNGAMMKPRVVKAIRKVNGSEEEIKSEQLASPISASTASKVTAMLINAVEAGYGKRAGVPGYKVAGKTGTAQVPNENGDGYSDKTIHSFAGYAPAFAPVFVGIVSLDNPKGVRFAESSATPVFGEIASYILNYYQVPGE